MDSTVGSTELRTEDIMHKLAAFRVAEGLSQKQVARKIGIAQATLWEWEQNKNPRLSQVQRYARALGLTVNFDIEDL